MLNVVQDSCNGLWRQFWSFALKDSVKDINYCIQLFEQHCLGTFSLRPFECWIIRGEATVWKITLLKHPASWLYREVLQQSETLFKLDMKNKLRWQKSMKALWPTEHEERRWGESRFYHQASSLSSREKADYSLLFKKAFYRSSASSTSNYGFRPQNSKNKQTSNFQHTIPRDICYIAGNPLAVYQLGCPNSLLVPISLLRFERDTVREQWLDLY